MSFRLGPDGKPVEIASSFGEPVKPLNEPSTQPPNNARVQSPPIVNSPVTAPGGEGTLPPRVNLFNHVAGQPPKMRPADMAIAPEPPTQPLRGTPGSAPGYSAEPISPSPVPSMPPQAPQEPKTSLAFNVAGAASESLTCGFLVVVDGPGRGKCLIIGPGQSAISRSPSERIVLNFGDTSITSKQQLLVIFDDENRDFIIAPGNGSSLNRLNGQIVAGQMILKSGDLLKVGSTTLRFVAFCDSSFSWI